ncbi:hypothetical protein [Neptuniibacter sp.]|uniref:hypothetical protein n=1 Tax=Neptuniibacter sp. TaxID=1962643 RepID=UPI002622B637|nr:hypothetical protein [Neptuniibacter sp.]MCP4595733.1 hypothetical protein [Neptuniibacter sp.]
MPEYTQGLALDGVAVLKDGVRLTAEEVMAELNGINGLIEYIHFLERKNLVPKEAITEEIAVKATAAAARVLGIDADESQPTKLERSQLREVVIATVESIKDQLGR